MYAALNAHYKEGSEIEYNCSRSQRRSGWVRATVLPIYTTAAAAAAAANPMSVRLLWRIKIAYRKHGNDELLQHMVNLQEDVARIACVGTFTRDEESKADHRERNLERSGEGVFTI